MYLCSQHCSHFYSYFHSHSLLKNPVFPQTWLSQQLKAFAYIFIRSFSWSNLLDSFVSHFAKTEVSSLTGVLNNFKNHFRLHDFLTCYSICTVYQMVLMHLQQFHFVYRPSCSHASWAPSISREIHDRTAFQSILTIWQYINYKRSIRSSNDIIRLLALNQQQIFILP